MAERRRKNTVTKDKHERIKQLLSMAWSTKSTARILAIADQILEIDPDNPDALIMKADYSDDYHLREKLLLRALTSFDNPDAYQSDDKELLFLVLNQRLAFTFFALNKYNEALKFCEASINFAASHDDLDDTDDGAMKSLYYRVLIELKDWQKILSTAMQDTEQKPGRAYAKLIAAYMLAPEHGRSVCASMFWDALILGPDIPFYMLGYFPEPDDDATPSEHKSFDFAVMYYDTLSVSDDFLQWFTRGVILFGLLSNRFDGREREYMLDTLDALGGFEEYEKMSEILLENDDRAIIEMLAAHKCLAE